MPSTLYAYLLVAYGLPPLNHRPDPAMPKSLKIDNQTTSDTYPGFCIMVAVFPDPAAEIFTLEMTNSPYGPKVQEQIEDRSGRVTPTGFAANITITLCKKDAPFLVSSPRRSGGSSVHGHRYLDANWKWICPRTADLPGTARRPSGGLQASCHPDQAALITASDCPAAYRGATPRCPPAPLGARTQDFEECRDRLGLTQPEGLRRSDRVAQPQVVLGRLDYLLCRILTSLATIVYSLSSPPKTLAGSGGRRIRCKVP